MYPSAFEAQWVQTAKTGSKDKACTFWEENGQPEFGASWKRWEACHEWRQDWHNYPHVVTWLNDGRYKQEPPAAPVKQGPRALEPVAVRAEREREERLAREQEDRIFGRSA